MGFTPKRTTFVLDFEGTELDGLTVRARHATLGTFMHLGELAVRANEEDGADQLEAMQAQLDLFDEVLVGWDLLDEDGNGVPANAAGLKTLEPGHAKLIINAWRTAMSQVTGPLVEPSSSGSPSEALSLPMEPLSPSQAA